MESTKVGRLLARSRDGETKAREELFAVVYSELRGLAGALMRDQAKEHTLQATALVHEAYMRLLPGAESGWENERHFRLVAARAMRSVLVDHARARAAVKRGGDRVRVQTSEFQDLTSSDHDLLSIEDVLGRLESLDSRASQVVEMKCFGGFNHEEIGESLGVSSRSVDRLWRFARAWIMKELAVEE